MERALVKKELPITVHQYEEEQNRKGILHIGRTAGLSSGQLLIDAPRLLNNKSWCVQLPKNKLLNHR